jgi:FAD/FMN-containing dehydrogenase
VGIKVFGNDYEKKKRILLEQIQKNSAGPIALKKKTSNLFRHTAKTKSPRLDVRRLNQVISVDPVNRIVETEGMTTYEDLVKETLKYSLLPAVVPELKSITIGGAFVGIGIEASSFRYGFVHETVEEIEVLTGDGKIINCRKDNEHRELFFAFANSYGSLGYILKLKAQLIPARPYVHIQHQKFADPTLYFQTLQSLTSQKQIYDFVEGAIFSKTEMVISTGKFVDSAPYTSNYRYMNIYYQSLRNKMDDYLTTGDFIWRWDPDWFWCSKHFGMNNRLLRLLFGKWMLKSTVYWKIRSYCSQNSLLRWLLEQFSSPAESVVQDICIPIANAPEFLHFLFQNIGITPIWVCPYQSYLDTNPYPLLPTDPSSLYIDFGFWDLVPSKQTKGYYNRLIEQKTTELQGFKSLYSDCFYPEEAFWEIYPRSKYMELKQKYDPSHNLKSLYEKCVTDKHSEQ